MGEKTASQVQDVVVAGSQSSNFLLPKENKSSSAGVPRLTMAGLCSEQSLQRFLPSLPLSGDCPSDGRSTHPHRVGVKCYCTSDPGGPPAAAAGGWNDSKSPPHTHSASIRLYYCISGNSSQNKPCPIVMIVLISAV